MNRLIPPNTSFQNSNTSSIMKYIKLINSISIVVVFILISSCVKSEDFDFDKIKKIEWNPQIAIPLASSSLTIEDIIKKTNDSVKFEFDQQGLVTLVYKYRLFSAQPSNMFTIPPASFTFSHTLTAVEAAAINSIGSLSIPFQEDFELTPADTIRIDSLIFNKGNIAFNLSGTINNNSSISLTIPEAKKNGSPLSQTFSLLNNGLQKIDLSGYKFDLTKVAGKPSTLRLNATLNIVNSPPGSISAGKTININLSLNPESVKVISGYLGKFTLIDEATTEDITIINNVFGQSNFNFLNPYLKFTFTNSIGIPAQFRFKELRSKNTTTGQSISLIGNPGLPNPFEVLSPSYVSNLPYISTQTVSNSGTNGALNSFFNIKPDKIFFNFTSIANPKGDIAENFLRESSTFSVDVEAGLPLSGYVKNLTVQDTFDFNIDKINEVENLLLRTIIDNEMPLSASIQVYFTDAHYIKIDSLITTSDPLVIPASIVNTSTGELSSSAKKTTDYTLAKPKINKIMNAKKILVKALLNTSGSATQNIKIYNSYKMTVKLAAQVEIKKNL